jgi:hypothetical protein
MCAPSIRNMHWSQDLHDQLMEERLRRAVKKDRLNTLYLELVALDPENGETWFASDAVSDELDKAIEQVTNRIEWLIGT